MIVFAPLPADRYNSLIADQAKSEQLKQQFQQSVRSDEHLMGLMQKIGIPLS
ncbi:hypothetical protein [Pseudomonas sp. LRF_L74]|uniref:hypothetical protein n=1 Tax=Pseudomonas sp. LRF_L74 TaxID=3369422 RepID=UPI003F60F5B4